MAIALGVNVDHVATIRQARRTVEPDPVLAASLAEKAGATCITVHLREDKRHIQDEDVRRLRKSVRGKLNLEMANVPAIVDFALKTRPDQATLVPEKRQEVTTEGGLDVLAHREQLKRTVRALKDAGILVSLFVDTDKEQLEACAETGAEFIELHTGPYANARGDAAREQLEIFIRAAGQAKQLGLRVNAGHGINYQNAGGMLRLPHLEEVNIGHSIVSRAVFVGMEQAVAEMHKLLNP